MARSEDALVIGAGVIGLSTGISLVEAGRQVRIRAAELPGGTSLASGAMCGPPLPGTVEPAITWERTTIEEMTALAGSPGTGVRLTRGRLASAAAGRGR